MFVVADPEGTVTVAGGNAEILHVEMSADGSALVVLAGVAARELDGKLPHVVEHLPDVGEVVIAPLEPGVSVGHEALAPPPQDGDAPKAWIEARRIDGTQPEPNQYVAQVRDVQVKMGQASQAMVSAQRWIAAQTDDSGAANDVQNSLNSAVDAMTTCTVSLDAVSEGIQTGEACEPS